MRLFNVHGRLVKKNVAHFRIKWDAKSKSKLQFRVKQFLKPFWQHMVVFEEFPVYGTLLKVDFINATKNLAIEVNGSQHDAVHPFFHQNRKYNFLQSINRDVRKREWLERNHFRLLEIQEEEVDQLTLEFFKEKFGVDLIA